MTNDYQPTKAEIDDLFRVMAKQADEEYNQIKFGQVHNLKGCIDEWPSEMQVLWRLSYDS